MEKNMEVKKKKIVREFILSTINGMTFGLFATLIIGTIIAQIATVFVDTTVFEVINTTANTLKALTGVGIGVSIALTLKQTGIRFVSVAVAGAIATSFVITSNGFEAKLNIDPVITYLVVIGCALFVKFVFAKKTNFDIILVPLSSAILAMLITAGLSFPVTFIIRQIADFITAATNLLPIPMSILISVVMGMTLTGPISSLAISLAINLGGIAAGAAVIGCSTQMVGFAVQSIRDNKTGDVLSIMFGTSMLQLKNVIKKPVIWLPTIIASAIIGPIGTMIFKLESNSVGGGMGTSGLVGPLQTLEIMGYSSIAFWGVGICLFLLPAVLVFIIDLLFRKLKLIKENDFVIESSF